MQIAIPLFDRFTALDAIGPYEVLSRLPGATVTFVASEAGLYQADTRMLTLRADAAFADVPSPDVLVFPGGFGTRRLTHDPETLDWVRGVHATSTWTTSVCTGALVLAGAGLLDGRDATTHWAARDELESLGARYTAQRVVELDDGIITAAGVSSGIDMALTLAAHIAGDTIAQAIQLGIEYDPQPPFDSGSPDKAPADVMAMALGAERAEAGTGAT